MGTKASADRVAAAMSADAIRAVIHPTVCSDCEAICWSVRVWAEGVLGSGKWRTDFTLRDHVSCSQAILHLSRSLGVIGWDVRGREDAIAMREGQPALW